MTTFILRVSPDDDETIVVEERVRTLALGAAPVPLPKLHVRSHKEAGKVAVDFAPDNKGVKAGTAGVMRGAQRGAF